ncbi:DUF2634 domain-containing protein [Oscillibacter sp.]|uniref:DUF2634 domain-containing protein n=1 Tax=Oscillibacter sp. TaxID=1945593 RepID=UPI00260D4A33|nr:DUF2634 domain-containing protein [Oscillibacter sp.]MDD3347330.1 DUF2634 domain-containing protein [Oscillibacter sp.]
MIPEVSDDLQQDFEFAEFPTNTFKLNISQSTVAGHVDNIEAMKQVIYLILNVERYEYLIHTWNYGVELKDLFGQPISFVLPEVKRRITEALLQDERITAVDDFEFEVNRGKVHATFTVTTIFGDIQTEKAVEI